MNKRLIIGLTLILTVVMGAYAFAATPMGHMMNFDQMKDMHNQMVQQQVKDGAMTPEQAKAMDSCLEFMSKNGSGMMGQMAPMAPTKQ